MDVAVAVGGLHHVAQGIGQILVLLAAAGMAGAGIGMLNHRENVIAVDAAATGGGDAVDVPGLLIRAARLVGLHIGHIVVAVVVVIGADIALGCLGLAGVILDDPGQSSQIVVVGVGINAHRIVGLDVQTGGIVRVRIGGDQQRRGRRWYAARPRPGCTAVGAGIHICNYAIHIVVICRGVVNPRANAAGRTAQRSCARGVMETLAVDGLNRVAVGVVNGLHLLQHRIVGHAGRPRPQRAAGAVGAGIHHVAAGTVVLTLAPQPARIGLGDQIAAMIVVILGGQGARLGSVAGVDVEDLRLIDAALLVVAVGFIGAEVGRRQRLQHAVGNGGRYIVAEILLCFDGLIQIVVGGDDNRPVDAIVLARLNAVFFGHQPIAPIVPVLGDAIGGVQSGIVGLLREIAVLVVEVGSDLHEVGGAGAHPVAERFIQAVVGRLINGAVRRRGLVEPSGVVVAVRGLIVIGVECAHRAGAVGQTVQGVLGILGGHLPGGIDVVTCERYQIADGFAAVGCAVGQVGRGRHGHVFGIGAGAIVADHFGWQGGRAGAAVPALIDALFVLRIEIDIVGNISIGRGFLGGASQRIDLIRGHQVQAATGHG